MKVITPPFLVTEEDGKIYAQRLSKWKRDWQIRRRYWKELRKSGSAFDAPATSIVDREFLESFSNRLLPTFAPMPKLANFSDFILALALANGRRDRPGVLSLGQVKAFGMPSLSLLINNENRATHALFLMALPEWRSKALDQVTAVVLFLLSDATVLGHAEALPRGHLFLPGDRVQAISMVEVRLFFPTAFARYQIFRGMGSFYSSEEERLND